MTLPRIQMRIVKVRYARFIAVLAVALLASGCRSSMAQKTAAKLNREAEASGSPYRFRAHRAGKVSALEKYRAVPPIPRPPPADLESTSADAELQRDVLGKIRFIQQGWGRIEPPVLLGVKPVSTSEGVIRETWFVKHDDGAARYDVTLSSSEGGGTHYSVTGPVD
jgi:hypothetical protein